MRTSVALKMPLGKFHMNKLKSKKSNRIFQNIGSKHFGMLTFKVSRLRNRNNNKVTSWTFAIV